MRFTRFSIFQSPPVIFHFKENFSDVRRTWTGLRNDDALIPLSVVRLAVNDAGVKKGLATLKQRACRFPGAP
jgi:hypothetical protein